MGSDSGKVVWIALLGNVAVAISKFAAAAVSGSSALLAEAFHSSADVGNEFLLIFGQKRSLRPPDEAHPFGHGRELYFWALIVAMLVFAVGGGLSIYQGVEHLLKPEPLEDPKWNYVVIGVAAIFEGYSWFYSRRELNRRRRPAESLWQLIHRSKDPALFTVFIEDSADLLGLALAFFGVLLSQIFAAPALDAGASVLIGLLLVVSAVILGVETGGLLIGEGAGREEVRTIRQIIASEASVMRVGDVLTMQLGPDEVLLVAEVDFRDELGSLDLKRSIDDIERRVREQNPAVKRIFFEAESLKKNDRGTERAA